MNISAPRGTADILPKEAVKWQIAEAKIKDICSRYHFEEIRTPLFEHTELFQRGVGDSTDIVQKEMYTFQDRGGRSLTLRPEGTASVARAFVQNKLYGDIIQPVKLYYFMQMFRYERPQQGRMRQLNQFGVEVLGSDNPAVDAEVIDLAMTVYKELGLKSLKLVINSLGDQESRKNYREALIGHFTPVKEELCHDCQTRLQQNPMRILDCKTDRNHPAMKTAPSILDYLNEESETYFNRVKTYLDLLGITYEVDPNLVRGLDYYNHTAFEIMSNAEGFGAITTLAGGGRYNGLIEEISGPSTPGIGFGMGMERLLMALEAENVNLERPTSLDCYLISVGEKADQQAMKVLHDLRDRGIRCDRDYQGRKMKAQFKTADRLQAKYVLVLGEEELDKQVISVKNMKTKEQTEIRMTELADNLYNQLHGGQGHE